MKADYQTRIEEPQAREQKTRNRLLAIIAVLLVIWGLRVSAPVTLPLAIALFLVALFWPLQHRLERKMPRGVAAGLTLLCFLFVVALFVAALWYAVEVVSQQWPRYEEQFQQLVETVQRRAQELGISLSGGGSEGSGGVPQGILSQIPAQVVTFLAAFLLIIAYLIFGLVEVHDYRAKLDKGMGGSTAGNRWIEVARQTSSDFQRFVVVRGSVALVTGTLVFLLSQLVGLDFAFIWGLTTFVLEFVPTVGTFVSMIPPMLFSIFQFDSTGKVVLVLLGFGAIQFVMGNIIEPFVEGKYLKLSPLVVLISIAFWAWVWGVAGAFIALPLTILVVLACKQFDRTRWIAVLLSSNDKNKRGGRTDT